MPCKEYVIFVLLHIMKNKLIDILGTALFLIILSFCCIGCGGDNGHIVPKCDDTEPVDTAVADTRPKGKPNKIIYWNRKKEFNDVNDTHLAAANKIGIRPLDDRSGIPNASRPLHLICSHMGFRGAEPYVVDVLTHSSPFLVEEAANLLTDIGVNFQDSLKNKHLSPYSVVVTSVLRTKDDAKRLSKRNVNALENSVHSYGTTIDISCKRFAKHRAGDPDAREVDLIAVLGEVLYDLKKAGRCYVKYEIKQHCFHITARK